MYFCQPRLVTCLAALRPTLLLRTCPPCLHARIRGRRGGEGDAADGAEGMAIQGNVDGKGRWEREGNSYEGNFKDGHFEGSGVFQWPTGESFAGEWDTDCPRGGKLSQQDGSVRVVTFDGTTPLFNGSNVVSLDQLKIVKSGYPFVFSSLRYAKSSATAHVAANVSRSCCRRDH